MCVARKTKCWTSSVLLHVHPTFCTSCVSKICCGAAVIGFAIFVHIICVIKAVQFRIYNYGTWGNFFEFLILNKYFWFVCVPVFYVCLMFLVYFILVSFFLVLLLCVFADCLRFKKYLLLFFSVVYRRAKSGFFFFFVCFNSCVSWIIADLEKKSTKHTLKLHNRQAC